MRQGFFRFRSFRHLRELYIPLCNQRIHLSWKHGNRLPKVEKQKSCKSGKHAMFSSVQAHSASIGRRVFRQEKTEGFGKNQHCRLDKFAESRFATDSQSVRLAGEPLSIYRSQRGDTGEDIATFRHSGKIKKLPRFAKQLLAFVRMKGLEPPRLTSLDPKSNAATNYATCAEIRHKGTTLNRFLQI